MTTKHKINRFVQRWPLNKLITTRQLLNFGTRNSVDQVTLALVRRGILVRVAWGVFVREGSDLTKITPLAVARVKARAFEKAIVEHAIDTAKRLEIIEDGNDRIIYSHQGHSSSFRFLLTNTRIHFKGVSARKFKLAGTRMADTVRALWHICDGSCGPVAFHRAIVPLNRSDRDELFNLSSLMPGWIHKEFAFVWDKSRKSNRRAFEKPQ